MNSHHMTEDLLEWGPLMSFYSFGKYVLDTCKVTQVFESKVLKVQWQRNSLIDFNWFYNLKSINKVVLESWTKVQSNQMRRGEAQEKQYLNCLERHTGTLSVEKERNGGGWERGKPAKVIRPRLCMDIDYSFPLSLLHPAPGLFTIFPAHQLCSDPRPFALAIRIVWNALHLELCTSILMHFTSLLHCPLMEAFLRYPP